MRWKQAVQILLFVLSWMPVGVLVGTTVFNAQYDYPQDFSVWSEHYNGLSEFRSSTEEQGYDVKGIQASMSVVSRFHGNAVLVIMGPVKDFSKDSVLTIFTHLSEGGSVLIADDFGTANSSFYLLNNYLLDFIGGSQLRELGVEGFLSYTGGVLLDLDSYDKSPKLPVIQDFETPGGLNQLVRGVKSQGGLHLNWASALSPTCLLGSPVAGFAWTTPRAWSETNISDPNPSPDDDEIAGRLPVAGALDLGALTNGEGGRLVALSDPSVFDNDMWNRFAGNRQLGRNIIQWLSHGSENMPVLFSENLLAVPWNSPEFLFGEFLSRALWMSTNPWLAPLYPIFTAVGIKKYLPDPKKPEVKSVSEVFMRKGETYFTERMSYYRREGNYARVIKMLYRKLRRDLRKKHMWRTFDTEKLWELMKFKDPKRNRDDFFETLDRIEEISGNPDQDISENELMRLFFFMRNIHSSLVETTK